MEAPMSFAIKVDATLQSIMLIPQTVNLRDVQRSAIARLHADLLMGVCFARSLAVRESASLRVKSQHIVDSRGDAATCHTVTVPRGRQCS